MLTAKVGDIFEAGPLLTNLTSEQILVQVQEVSEDPERVLLCEVTYFGVHLGTASCYVGSSGDGVWAWNIQGDSHVG